MKPWLIVAAVLCLLLCYPLVRFMVKRVLLYGKLRRACRRHGVQLEGTRLLWFFAVRGGDGADFRLHLRDRTLSVKLFATFRYASHLIFTRNNCYCIKHFIAVFAHYQKLIMPIEGKRHDLSAFFRAVGDDREEPCERVLLVHPVCIEIRREGQAVPLGDGDEINGVMLLSLAGLIRMISS